MMIQVNVEEVAKAYERHPMDDAIEASSRASIDALLTPRTVSTVLRYYNVHLVFHVQVVMLIVHGARIELSLLARQRGATQEIHRLLESQICDALPVTIPETTLLACVVTSLHANEGL
eukprot:6201368-Pleurochrysis_carterae.AAC.3